MLFRSIKKAIEEEILRQPDAKEQKNLAEADGSRDNLPPEAEAPKQFGLGMKREEPKHY